MVFIYIFAEKTDMEEFRDIKEYEGLYQVSSLGRVKNSKGRILKSYKDNHGYPMVNLCKNAKNIRVRVHRLVAEAFIPNPNNYPCVNHKDEDKSNNNVNNLEWCTYRYNNTYGTVLQRKLEKLKETYKNFDWSKITSKIDYKEVGRKNAEKLSKKVYQYTKDGEFVKEWKSVMECGRNGYNSGHISNACVGRLKTYKGFIWTYDKNYIHKEITYDNRKPVLQFTLNGEFVMEWATAAEAERNGFDCSHISECCRGKRKTHKGYIWKYK